jgi:hypothetical protein
MVEEEWVLWKSVQTLSYFTHVRKLIYACNFHIHWLICMKHRIGDRNMMLFNSDCFVTICRRYLYFIAISEINFAPFSTVWFRFGKNSAQEMWTKSNCMVVRFLIIGPKKAILYVGVWVNFCPTFSLLFSDLGEIPHKRLEHNNVKHLWVS